MRASPHATASNCAPHRRAAAKCAPHRRRSPPLLLLPLLLLAEQVGSSYVALPLVRGSIQRHRGSRASVVSAREITKVADAEAYHALIEEATAENRIVVIKFYASWCRACKAMAPKFIRITEDWPNIEFHEVLFDDNKKLCKELGIKILPYMEIIAGDRGKIDGFTCGPSKVSLLVRKLEDTSERYCDLYGDPIECTDVSGMLDD